ncbi:MAG: phosphoribosyltransferase [Gammaproteobacteria bacterium]|nr:phosphoribosyltransferase [Gammaproteobacteria bacterium]
MRCELISWSETERLCQRLAGLIRESGYRPDLVIAIGRGGYVPARLLCDYLNIMGLTSIKIEHYLSGANRQEEAVIRYPLKADIRDLRVLLVDDVNDTGDTLEVAMQHLQAFQPGEIRTAVMHHKAVTHFKVDYYARKIIKWRWLIYPWAVNEDVSGFLQRLTPAPGSLEDARKLLAERFNIEISSRRLRNIYAFLDRKPELLSKCMQAGSGRK